MNKYFMIAKTVLKRKTVYRMEIISRMVATLISVLALRQVWTSLFQNSESSVINGMTLEMMVTYTTVAMLLQAFYGPTVIWEVSQKILDGNIVTELNRPWDYQLSVFSRSIGEIVAGILTIVLPIAIITIILFPIDITLSVAAWLTFIFSIIIGVMINFALQFFIGLLAFVFVEVWGFEIVLSLVITFFSGKFIPLSFYPEYLREFAYFLPFRALFDIPLSIMVGTASPSEYLSLIGFQAAWAIVLMVGVRMLVGRFQKLLVVAGG